MATCFPRKMIPRCWQPESAPLWAPDGRLRSHLPRQPAQWRLCLELTKRRRKVVPLWGPSHPACGRDVEPSKLPCACRKSGTARQLHELLQRRTERIALTHEQIEVLDRKRDEVDARGSRNGAGCNAPIAMACADYLRDVGTGCCLDRGAEVDDL